MGLWGSGLASAGPDAQLLHDDWMICLRLNPFLIDSEMSESAKLCDFSLFLKDVELDSASDGSRPILSSTPLQVLLYLNSWYFAAFYLAEILIFIYKGVSLPYTSDNLALDVALLLLFLAFETPRIFYGRKGNLCEISLASCVSLFILFPCAALAMYYLLLQTFVLRLEFLLNAILLCFYVLEFLLGLLSLSAFSR